MHLFPGDDDSLGFSTVNPAIEEPMVNAAGEVIGKKSLPLERRGPIRDAQGQVVGEKVIPSRRGRVLRFAKLRTHENLGFGRENGPPVFATAHFDLHPEVTLSRLVVAPPVPSPAEYQQLLTLLDGATSRLCQKLADFQTHVGMSTEAWRDAEPEGLKERLRALERGARPAPRTELGHWLARAKVADNAQSHNSALQKAFGRPKPTTDGWISDMVNGVPVDESFADKFDEWGVEYDKWGNNLPTVKLLDRTGKGRGSRVSMSEACRILLTKVPLEPPQKDAGRKGSPQDRNPDDE